MREIFIEKDNSLRRIAIKEGEKLIECCIEEDTNEPLPGEIYKGIVKNIVPAIKCAFVDIGHSKNAYMYLSEDKDMSIKKGQEVLVEVVKEVIGTKGAKVVPIINLPGRYAVISNKNKDVSFSKKIENQDFKAKAVEELDGIIPLGIKIRTQGQYVPLPVIKAEVEELYSIYEEIDKGFKFALRPKRLYGENSLVYKILRDFVTDDTESIVVNSEKDYKIIDSYIDDKEDIKAKLKFYDGHRTLLDFYGVEKDILALRHPKVALPCGGSLIIESTEAMYVIDVNSGKNTKATTMEKTAFLTNSEAATEIARQIRLRNLSGIVVVDFIDMTEENHKKKVLKLLEEGFKGDKNKTVIYSPTELNLVQIARRRRGKTIYEYMEESCKECHGHGKKLKLDYITLLIRNDILKKDGDNSVKDMYIEINSIYKKAIEEDIVYFLKDIEALDKNIYLNFTEKVEYFKVEPLIFMNQVENVKKYRIDLDNL